MSRTERLALYALVLLAIALALRPGSLTAPAAAISAAPPAADPARVAVVAVTIVADELMNSDRYRPKREEFEKSQREDLLKPLEDELAKLRARAEPLDPKGDEFRRLAEEAARVQGRLAATQQEISRRYDQLIAGQLKEVYGLIRGSAQAVAESRGFSHVVASMRPDDKLVEAGTDALVKDLLGRPLLVYPEAADLTDEVRADLKLK
ncbi:MAG: OmpH family outer membrane protein [Phycisphaerales bacterium]|nr:OmpH family outer membrane protein [Phycisphaerales bacterium]